jgi:uncharacterized glyoxalase superfamily protein PhnB
MPANRSIPQCTVIPELAYPDLGEAVDWFCDAFGFTLRLRIANHRAQLNVGDGAVVLTEQRGRGQDSLGAVSFPPSRDDPSHSELVRALDVERHYQRATQRGVQIKRPPR